MDTVITRKKPMKNISDLGFDIREERCKRNISRMSAAKYCGVSCNAFSMWEFGAAKKMSQQSFDKLMELLGPESAAPVVVEETDAVS